MTAPTVVSVDVYPVAGRDCMELNLSGAHGPYFTRNVVVLTDSTGAVGVGEVPGGEKITATIEDAREIVGDTPEHFAAFQQRENQRWKQLIETRKITAD